MPTFENPTADAAEAREVLRGLAHATREVDDPRALYAILGDLSAAATSLGQALHQLASVHDVRGRETAWVPEDPRSTRAATGHISWNLHRAGEILKQVASCLDDAHQAEGTVVYQHREFATPAPTAQPTSSRGLGL